MKVYSLFYYDNGLSIEHEAQPPQSFIDNLTLDVDYYVPSNYAVDELHLDKLPIGSIVRTACGESLLLIQYTPYHPLGIPLEILYPLVPTFIKFEGVR